LQGTNQANKVGESLSAKLKEKLQQEPNLAIGEVAGRDSAAAIIKAASYDFVGAVLPTLVCTGTEYGSWETVLGNVALIKDRVDEGYKKRFYDAILLGDVDLWWALNGRFLSVLSERFGFYSPCFGCHLYMHLVRVPLAKELNCRTIISGERVKHDNQIKINQTSIVLDAYEEVLGFSGIRLIFPVREISSGSEIKALVGDDWEEGDKQLKCVLSGNYRLLTGEVLYDEAKIKIYLDEFIVPVGRSILKAWEEEEPVDYVQIVRRVLAAKD